MSSSPDTTPPPSTFMQAAGLVLDKVETSHVTGWIDLGSEPHQPWALVHGGVVAAIALNASSTVLRDEGADPASQLRAATFGYVRGNTVGDLSIDIEIIRQGRAIATTHARVSQGDKTTTVARFHHSTPWD